MPGPYVLPTTVRLSVAFSDADGAAADPTTVVCRVADPQGRRSYPSVVHDSLGNYHADVVANVEGVWAWIFEGSGTISASTGDKKFRVNRSTI